jgi:hypothetical protein
VLALDSGGDEAASARSDDDGSFTLTLATLAPVVVRVDDDAWIGAPARLGRGVDGGTDAVELLVARACDVEGVVRARGFPRAGVAVACGSDPRASSAAGHFALRCPCAAPSLRLDDGGGARDVPVGLVSGATSWIELRL